ncbi:MAG: alpha/beta fold hydrolase [Gemmatimonadaceae bacterium]|jgi:haloalkane dehalogenase|nr:alpha/beta fold hydrolase [Gemmatimonadaceae bacterium]
MRMSVTVTGGRLQVTDVGRGPLVVCVHGTPTFSHEWRHVVAGLSDRFRVVAPDHLGFGYSDRPHDADYSPEAHARRFSECLAQVAPTGPLTLVVHDFGGPIALDWALNHPDRLTRLVIVNSWMWSFDDDPQMRRRARMASTPLARWLYRRWNASLRIIMPSAYGDRRALTSEIHQIYLERFSDPEGRDRVLFALAASLLGSRAFFASLWSRRDVLASVPMNIMWGMCDSAFRPSFLTRWIETFPHAAVHRFVRAGHWPHEEEPRTFVDILERMLVGDVSAK